MNWNTWARQALMIAKVELARYFLARRWIGVYLIAAAPVFLLLVAAFQARRGPNIGQASAIYAVFFQTFWLRLAIFFSCMAVFSQMFRGEVLEKTLHFYLLVPVRREVIAAGKYLAGVIAMGGLFTLATIVTNILIYVRNPGYADFFLEGNGTGQLFRYLVAVVIACVAYGGIFLFLGLWFRNPIIPSIVLLGWETFYFVLPERLQKLTVMHYIQSFLPVSVDMGAFAVVIDPTPPVLGIPILLIFAGLLVWLSGRILRTTEISYSTD